MYEQVPLAAMSFVVEELCYRYYCPCGDVFEIGLDELWDGEDVAPCASCTLRIRVLYEEEDLPRMPDDEDDDETLAATMAQLELVAERAPPVRDPALVPGAAAAAAAHSADVPSVAQEAAALPPPPPQDAAALPQDAGQDDGPPLPGDPPEYSNSDTEDEIRVLEQEREALMARLEAGAAKLEALAERRAAASQGLETESCP